MFGAYLFETEGLGAHYQFEDVIGMTAIWVDILFSVSGLGMGTDSNLVVLDANEGVKELDAGWGRILW